MSNYNNLTKEVLHLYAAGWSFYPTNYRWVKDNFSCHSLEEAICHQKKLETFSIRWNTDYADSKLMEYYSKLVSSLKEKHIKEYHLWNLELEELKKKKDSE